MTGKREQSAISNKSDSDSDSDDETFSKTRVRNSIDELAQTNFVFIIFKLNRLTKSVWICEAVEDLNLSKNSQQHVSKTLIFQITR